MTEQIQKIPEKVHKTFFDWQNPNICYCTSKDCAFTCLTIDKCNHKCCNSIVYL